VLFSILDLIRAMELVYRLLELTVGDRLRILGIDQRVDEARRTVLRLVDELERQQQQGAGQPHGPGGISGSTVAPSSSHSISRASNTTLC